MGIYGAMTTAISGLKAQSFALENISGNIANSQTVGYKRLETSFIDLIADAALGQQTAGAVTAFSRATNNVGGDIITSTKSTDIALNGSGFLVVGERIGLLNGVTTFTTQDLYTRRGDFSLDAEGYLVNGSGFYLKGVPISAVTGAPAGSQPEVIKVNNALYPSKSTDRVDYRINLPANTSVDVGDVINGGSVTVFYQDGATANLQMQWTKTADTPATWSLSYLSDSATLTWTPISTAAVFNADGTMASLAGSSVNARGELELPITGLVLEGQAIGNVTLNLGVKGLTNFANSTQLASNVQLIQNGYPSGSFVDVVIDDNGRVIANYSNGEQVEMYQLVVANFNAENMLKRQDGGAYSATVASGPVILSLTGSFRSGALEMSNTDISEEFTKLIVTQQAYAAGTRIVSTSDEMMQEALNMVR